MKKVYNLGTSSSRFKTLSNITTIRGDGLEVRGGVVG